MAIVGPPNVGKTTLLKSLIRRYAKETMTEPLGPITVVTSKKQRLTFIECPTELEAMVDIAKVAEVVLLMIDGHYGFEMETLEFLNILAATGMPGNVFGILTHLDLFRKPQALKDAKKRLKSRLWKELYQGAHLFYLSGVINGRYPDREIHNLSRFLSQMKNPRPLVWRNSHPYAIIDNVRDITHPNLKEENPKCDRNIVLSGYLRGTNFSAQGQRVHIPGVGDFTVADIEVLPDPCPTPQMEKAIENATGKTGRRRLDDKEKKVHAPLSDRSGFKMEGDALWITRPKGVAANKDVEGAEDDKAQDDDELDGVESGEQGDIRLVGGGGTVKVDGDDEVARRPRRGVEDAFSDDDDDAPEGGGLSEDDEFVSGDESDESDEADVDEEFDEGKLGRIFRKDVGDVKEGDFAFADEDSDLGSLSSAHERSDRGDDDTDADTEGDDSDDDPTVRWKGDIVARANAAHGRVPYRTADLAKLLYGSSLTPKEAISKWSGKEAEKNGDADDDAADDEFFKKAKPENSDADETVIPQFDYDALSSKWFSKENLDDLRRRKFTTSKLAKGSGEDGDGDEAGDDDGEEDKDDDDEGDGAFEDLETGEKHGPIDHAAEREKQDRKREEFKARFEEEDREGLFNDKAIARREGGEDEEFGEDEWYDAQKAMIQKQLNINREEYENIDEAQRAAVEGYRAGKYARLVIKGVPAEFMENFQARMPIIVGGLTPTEDRFGFVQMRIKRHRWHKKILKTNDPLIFSLGWRRFQTLPIYSTTDSRARNRMLKYTPEHMHCFGTFYGPLIAPNTGFVCFNSFSPDNPGFRIAASGTVLGVDESSQIVKKLKLTGHPYKIFKNTAFIKDMFNSALEVAKFEGASIKTVSGVRGQIKRALSKPDGHFRATFEDKILASDIVFLQAWYPVKPHRFYNPATNLIGWQRMRLTGEVRHDENIATPRQPNSEYREIVRETRRFNPLRVPRQLAAELPYKSQIVRMRPQNKKTYMQRRAVVLGGEEKKMRDLMQKLTTIHKDAVEKRKAEKAKKQAAFIAVKEAIREKREQSERKQKQEYWRREGRKRKPESEAGGGGGGKRRRK